MTLKELAEKHNYPVDALRKILEKENFKFTNNYGRIVIQDSDAENIIKCYRESIEDPEVKAKRLADERAAEEEARKEKERKQIALSNMLITSGFSFDGYTITKYSGYISGDDAVQVNRGFAGWLTSGTATNVGDALMASLSQIRRNALAELKEAAYDLGCNAVIGVDFDYITLEPETANATGGTTYLPYVFGVTANGNAVVIEKNFVEDDD